MMNIQQQTSWSGAIREHRERKGFSRPALARLSRVSASAIKAFENGTRRPSHDVLNRIIEALGLTRDEANPIVAGVGYAIDAQALFGGRWVAEPGWLDELVDACPWPVFVTGQGINIVHANRPLQRVWDIDLSQEFVTDRRNLLGGASLERFARCAENYDELLALMMGLMKADPRLQQNLERPAPWMRDALTGFLQGEPKYIRRLLKAWDRAEPIPHRTRIHYEVRWRHRGERPMRFLGVLTIADIWNELSWNDWIPADGATWTTLGEIMSVPR